MGIPLAGPGYPYSPESLAVPLLLPLDPRVGPVAALSPIPPRTPDTLANWAWSLGHQPEHGYGKDWLRGFCPLVMAAAGQTCAARWAVCRSEKYRHRKSIVVNWECLKLLAGDETIKHCGLARGDDPPGALKLDG